MKIVLKANCPIISSGWVGSGSGNANPLSSPSRQHVRQTENTLKNDHMTKLPLFQMFLT